MDIATDRPAFTIELADTDRMETPADVPGFEDAIFRGIVWDYSGPTPRIGEIGEGDRASLSAWLRGHGQRPRIRMYIDAIDAQIARLAA